jgi:hypothetical protein
VVDADGQRAALWEPEALRVESHEQKRVQRILKQPPDPQPVSYVVWVFRKLPAAAVDLRAVGVAEKDSAARRLVPDFVDKRRDNSHLIIREPESQTPAARQNVRRRRI